jgi:glycogen operon protein
MNWHLFVGFLAITILSVGMPMILMGDEARRSQGGNNNAYAQDNEITWLDWARLEQNGENFRFFKLMIAFRKAHPSIGRLTFWREAVKWFGADGPVELGAESRCLAYFLDGESVDDDDLYVMINGHWEDRTFTVQEGAPKEWRRVVDTARPSPEDIVEPGKEPKLESASYPVRARSVVVLRKERG